MDDVLLKRTGWGPLRIPGEKRRNERASARARRILENASVPPQTQQTHDEVAAQVAAYSERKDVY